MKTLVRTTTVTIGAGTLEGTAADDVLSFKGIPYARPPIGQLRWRAPQLVEPWTGVRPATAFGHDSMQVPTDDEIAPIATVPAENCLVLNVWRPAVGTPAGNFPVMVWLHGGGFVNGGSSAPVMNGAALSRRGVVVVSLNYRLGRLGFFAHPALLAARDGPVGNFGYMDQIAALKWVQANIGAFGGNPSAVTLVGESAGGASVLQLLTSPLAAGLFHRAVVLSGGGRRALAGRRMTGGNPLHPSADQIDAAFARSLGIEGTGRDALTRLRALSAATVVGDISVNQIFHPTLLAGATDVPGTPMIDGTLARADPGDILARREQARMPLLIGTTALDAPIHFPPRSDPFSFFGPDAEQAKHVYDPAGARAPSTVAVSIATDITMHEAARYAARAVAASGEQAWLFRFSYVAETIPTRKVGAPHARELPYLFDTLDSVYGGKVTNKDRDTARAFSTYITNFVRTGDPNADDLPTWPIFDARRFDLMHFTVDEGPVFEIDPRADRVALVEKAADRI